ncbi:MAG: flavoprotein [Desulfurococcaceae archaeon]
MRKNVAWGITGAGALLQESISALRSLIKGGVGVTVFVSKAGETVLKMYGFKEVIENIVVGKYPTGIVYESSEHPGYPTTGRLYLGLYSAVIISPATLNTVGKIVNGIADSLVSALAMHALKTGIPIYVIPVDAFETKSTIPILIDRERCERCNACSVVGKCPVSAIDEHPYYKLTIDPTKCIKCRLCLKLCPLGAIRFDVDIVVKPFPYYLEIIERARRIDNLNVISSPTQVLELLGVEH